MLLLVVVLVGATPKLAIPSFTGTRADVATYCAERLGDELQRSGFNVVTEKQIAALIGLERQRQLLGCSDQSTECLAELTNALGADALVQGSVAQLGTRLQLDVRLFSAKTGERLGVAHAEAESEEQIPAALSRLAEELTPLVRQAFGMTYEPKRRRPGLATWVPAGAGVALGIAGGIFLGLGYSAHQSLTGEGSLSKPFTYEEGQQLARNEEQFANLGAVLLGIAVIGIAVGIAMWLVMR